MRAVEGERVLEREVLVALMAVVSALGLF